MAAAADAAAAAAPVQPQQPADNTEKVREAAKLFRVHQTVCEMVQDRGYELKDLGDGQTWLLNKDLDEFRAKILNGTEPLKRNQINFICSKPGDVPGSRHSLLVWYEDGDYRGPKKDTMQNVQKLAEENDCASAIVVSAQKVPAMVRNWVDASNRDQLNREGGGVKLEVFPEEHLVVNITRHELVPKHEPLGGEEAKKILEQFCLKIEMLPRILATDPVALYFGLKRGQVVKITRKSETAGQYVTFRQVV